jgi:hypothetical protein
MAYLAVAYVLSSNLFYITRSFADSSFTIVQSYLFFGAVMVLVALYFVRHAAARGDAEADAETRGMPGTPAPA